MEETLKRGDIYIADLAKGIGSEEYGIRPVIIISNDIGNNYSPIVIVVPITTKHGQVCKNKKFKGLPIHVRIEELDKISYALCEQIQTISKERLKNRISRLSNFTKDKVDLALKISLGID